MSESVWRTCPNCGTRFRGSDVYCSRCAGKMARMDHLTKGMLRDLLMLVGCLIVAGIGISILWLMFG